MRLLIAALLSLQQEKAPVPAEADQKRAETEIRGLLKADFAKKDKASRRAFAARLLKLAADPGEELVSRYVLLSEARDMAAEAGDAANVLVAADRLVDLFKIDPATAKAAALSAARKAATTPQEIQAAAEGLLGLAEEALGSGDFDRALQAAREAETSARSARDGALAARAAELASEAGELKRESDQAAKAELAVSANPDDPEANLVLGRYHALVRGDWAKSLPFLARAGDAALRDAARQDLAVPETPAAQVEAGDAWRSVAEKISGPDKRRYQARALHWFEKALPALNGLSRVRVQGFIDALSKAAEGKDALRHGLVFWVEPGRDPANPFRDHASASHPTNNGVTVVDKALSFSKSWVDFEVPAAVQSVDRTGSVFAWVKTTDPAHWGGLIDRGFPDKTVGVDDFALLMFRGHADAWTHWPANRARVGMGKTAMLANKWSLLGYTWDEKTLTMYFDGKEDGAAAVVGGPIPRRSARVTLGANWPGSCEYYAGLIGSAMIFNRTLTPADVAALHASGRTRFKP